MVFIPREIPEPAVPVICFDLREPRRGQGGGGAFQGIHFIGFAALRRPGPHFFGEGRIAAEPVAEKDPGSRTRDAEHLVEDRRLFRQVDNRVLGENSIERAVTERQRTGRNMHEIKAVLKTALAAHPIGHSKRRLVDVNSGNMARAVVLHQKGIVATNTASEVKHLKAVYFSLAQHSAQLFGAAGRKQALAPTQLQVLDQVVSVIECVLGPRRRGGIQRFVFHHFILAFNGFGAPRIKPRRMAPLTTNDLCSHHALENVIRDFMSRRLPSLNQLRAFEAAARHRSFKRGAAELCVTQAAVSHQVKSLERSLGIPLFIRRTREVALTPEAEELLGTLTRCLDDMEAGVLEVSGRTMTGDLHISAAPFYGNRWLLPRLPDFHAAYPGLTASVDLSFDLVDLAASGLHAALRHGTGDWVGLSAILVHTDRIGPVCAPHRVTNMDLPLSPARIAGLPLVTTRSWRKEWHQWFQATGYRPAGSLDIEVHENRALAFDAALSGNAVCLADIRLTAAAEATGSLVRLSPVTIEPSRGMYLVYPETSRPDPRVLALAEWLRIQADQALSTNTDPTE